MHNSHHTLKGISYCQTEARALNRADSLAGVLQCLTNGGQDHAKVVHVNAGLPGCCVNRTATKNKRRGKGHDRGNDKERSTSSGTG